MTMLSTLQRPGLIGGLRALADFLETHPDAPAPNAIDATAHVPRDTDAVMRAEIERLAAVIGSEVDPQTPGYRRTVRQFGPVQYRVIAVLVDGRARCDALLARRNAIDISGGAGR